MRKVCMLFCLTALLLLTACGGRPVSETGLWVLESAADGGGTPLPEIRDVTCTIEAGGALTLSGDLTGEGRCSGQDVDDTRMLTVELSGGVSFTGVCGVRTYDSGASTPVLLLSNEDYILSFLPQGTEVTSLPA